MKLCILHGEKQIDEWETLSEIELTSCPEQYTDSKIENDFPTDNRLGVDDRIIALPNDEEIKIRVFYTPLDLGVVFTVFKNDQILINVAGYKSYKHSQDPIVLFRTPGGLYLKLMISS